MTHITSLSTHRSRQATRLTVISRPTAQCPGPQWTLWAASQGFFVWRTSARCPVIPADAVVLTPESYPDQLAFAAPIPLTLSHATSAALLDMCSEHLFYSVELVNGRWAYSTGIGSHKQQHGCADTREEAIVMGQAHMWRNWLERLEYIRERRGGMLSFGIPLASPGPNAFREE